MSRRRAFYGGGGGSGPETDPVASAALTTHAGTDKSTAHPGTIENGDLADGTIAVAKLAFDPATQAELDAHTGTDKSSAHPGTVEAADIADATITLAKMAASAADPAAGTAGLRSLGTGATQGAAGNHVHTQAADSGAIADPTVATAEDVANKYNTLRTNLRAAGLMA